VSRETPIRCTRCILPGTVPGIDYDEEGVCSYCRAWRSPQTLGEAALRDLVAAAKRDGAPCDAIVPLSGGRDSTFVLHEAVRTLGLRVVAVNYDNEFRNETAVENMERACGILGVELVSVRSRRGIARRMVQDELRLNATVGLPPVSVCRACSYGYRSVVYRAAIEREAPLILWGSSAHERTDAMRKRAFRGLLGRRPRLLRLIDPDFQRLVVHSVMQRLEFPVPGTAVLSDSLPRLRRAGVSEVKFFTYVDWNRKRIKQTNADELGWKKPDKSVSTWKTDCDLHTCINYSYLALFGCTKDAFGYTNMINAGQMTRDEALDQEARTALGLGGKLPGLLGRRVGLPTHVAEALIEAPAARTGGGSGTSGS